MNYTLVSSDEELCRVCEGLLSSKVVAIDTEFVRTRTLTPQLGLIQIYDGNQLILIDPLPISDFSSLKQLLLAPEIIKVLHACSEDLETFNTAFGIIPKPVFDTQFAAALIGLGNSVGYARLIEMMLEISLDKGEARTDWLARPLSEKQLQYAANDVLYLLPAYQKIATQVDSIQKREWVYQEAAFIGQKKQNRVAYEFAYLQIKNNWRLSARQLTVLQELAAWRLKVAEQKNLALNFVFKETHLFEIAQRLPKSKNELSSIPGISPHSLRRYADSLIAIVAQALKRFDTQAEQTQLSRVRRLIDVPEYKKVLAKLKSVTDALAEEHGVPAELIASKKQLNQLLKWAWFDVDETRATSLQPDVLSGWRRALFLQPVADILGQEVTQLT